MFEIDNFCFAQQNRVPLKMLYLYLWGQNCLHLTCKPYLSSDTYSRKYEKLPNTVIHSCKNITEQINLLKMCGPQIRLFGFVFFTFRPIASKWLYSLTTCIIDTLSWLGGSEVTYPLWVREVPGSIPGSCKGFDVWFLTVVMSHFLSSVVSACVRQQFL